LAASLCTFDQVACGSCRQADLSLAFLIASFVSWVNKVSPVKGSSRPLAGLVSGLLEVHLSLSNQSSNIWFIVLGGRISFLRCLLCLCRNSLEAFNSTISSSVCLVDSVPFFNTVSNFSQSSSLCRQMAFKRLLAARK